MGIDRVVEANRDAILRLAESHGARNVRIFGSLARGDSGSESDIDFLVEINPETSLLDHIALIQDLEDLLGRKVDVISDKAIHWYIRERVIAEAKPL